MTQKPKQKPKTEADKAHDDLVEHMRKAMQNTHHRVILWWLLEQCGIYTQNMSANSTMYILEGQRSIGLRLIQLLEDVSPMAYPELLLEKARAVQASQINGEEGPAHVSEEVIE